MPYSFSYEERLALAAQACQVAQKSEAANISNPLQTRKLLEAHSEIKKSGEFFVVNQEACIFKDLQARERSLETETWLGWLCEAYGFAQGETLQIAPIAKHKRKQIDEEQRAIEEQAKQEAKELASHSLGLLCLSLARAAKDKTQRTIFSMCAAVAVPAQELQEFCQKAKNVLTSCAAVAATRFYAKCLQDFEPTEALREACFSASKGVRTKVAHAVQALALRAGRERNGLDHLEGLALKRLEARVLEKKGKCLDGDQIEEMSNQARQGLGLQKISRQRAIQNFKLFFEFARKVGEVGAKGEKRKRKYLYVVKGLRDLKEWLAQQGFVFQKGRLEHVGEEMGDRLGVVHSHNCNLSPGGSRNAL